MLISISPSPKLIRATVSPRKLRVVLLIVKAIAFVVQQLETLLLVPIENQVHLPWPGEDLWILDRRFVVDMVCIRKRVPLNDMQFITMKIAGMVEPCLIVEVGHIDDQGVAFPLSPRIAQPPIDV